MICTDCVMEKIKRPPEREGQEDRRKVQAKGILKKTDRREGPADRRQEKEWAEWPQDRPGYFEEQEKMNLTASRNTGQTAYLIYQGLSLCHRHFAKRKLSMQQDAYSNSRRETV